MAGDVERTPVLSFATWALVEQWERGWLPCNPSIARGPHGYAAIVTCRDLIRGDDGTSFRHADKSGMIRTRNFFSDLNDDLRPDGWRELPGPDGPAFGLIRGVEDPRLYWRDGWRFTGSISQHAPGELRRIALCSVDRGVSDVLDAPDGVWVKNLMPTGTEEPRLIDAMEQDERLHGGAVAAFEDGFLGIVHEVQWPGRWYHHRFARFDQSGALRSLSERFRFGEEPIEFAAGIVLRDEEVVVSYGVQDRQARLATIPLSTVLEAL